MYTFAASARVMLCALAAALYLLAGLGLALHTAAAHRVAALACTAELFGLLMVGAIGLAVPGVMTGLGPWNDFGSGYAYLPALAPLLGLALLLGEPTTRSARSR